MGDWSVQFGMKKRLAGMYFVPIDGDEIEMAVKPLGNTIVKMTIGFDAEPDKFATDFMTSTSDNPFGRSTLTVRGIPNEHYTQYFYQSVLVGPTIGAVKVNRAWEGKDTAIKFRSLGLDPLSELQQGRIESAVIVNMQTNNEVFTGIELLAKLQ